MSNETPILSRLKPPAGAVRKKKRKGRGPGSGLGKTAGKGMKGMKARHPGGFGKLGFEGGQTPLWKRIPKFGFTNPFSKEIATLNVKDLTKFDDSSVIGPQVLAEKGYIKSGTEGIKLLGEGDIDKAYKLKLTAISTGARQKVEAAGGSVELISLKDFRDILKD